jgi:hypothetical protein
MFRKMQQTRKHIYLVRDNSAAVVSVLGQNSN